MYIPFDLGLIPKIFTLKQIMNIIESLNRVLKKNKCLNDYFH